MSLFNINEPIPFAEFFSGVGLIRLGLEQAGFKCVFANEIDAKKNAIYTNHFGSAELVAGDIATLEASIIPQIKLATASFPCQDISLAGNRVGLSGQRSGTVWEFLRILSELRHFGRAPKAILLENVTGLLTSHQGSDIRSLLIQLNQLGYACDLLILDAVHFVPQSRPRVFVIGIQQFSSSVQRLQIDQYRPAAVQKVIAGNTDIDWHHLNLPELPQQRLTSLDEIWEYGDLLEWFDTSQLERERHYIRNLSLERLNNAVIKAVHTQKRVYLTAYRRMRGDQICLETRDDGIAGCLRPATGGSSRQVLIEVGPDASVRMRYLTAREYARLQGVDDSFQIPRAQRVGLNAFGDAVAVPVLVWIGRILRNELTETMPPATGLGVMNQAIQPAR